MSNRDFNYKQLRELLKDFDEVKINDLCLYLENLQHDKELKDTDKDKKGENKSTWFAFLSSK